MTTPWRSLAAAVDTAVDRAWGEPFRLVPWRAGEFDTGSPDLSRPVIEGAGVLFLGKGADTSLAGTVHGLRAQMEPRISNAEAQLSVSNATIGSNEPQQGDHLHMLDPARKGTINEVFMVVSALPDAADRWMIDLARAKD
jgi:hypothetical protein